MGKDILSKIVEDKIKEVAAAKGRFPEHLLRDQALISRRKRPFLKSLEEPGPAGINIIAEIKRASPSKGVIHSDLDPATYAVQYEQGGAVALSVLTDRPYFQGSPEDLKIARAITALPVLRKDFLISSYQIYESAVMSADAVLLITRILDQEQLEDFLAICNELQMDALVEIHSEKDLKIATLAGAKLIGINNRDLRSFDTDIATAIRLKSLLETDQIAVAASGIRTRNDIDKNREYGIWNFLIGESLVCSENPKQFLNSLLGQPF